jgi:DnaJ-domain-containing protein 1
MADGAIHEREIAVASRIYSALSGNRVTPQDAREIILQSRGGVQAGSVSPENALLLVEAALDVMIADSVLKKSEVVFLQSIATQLGLTATAADAAIARRFGQGHTTENGRQDRQSRARPADRDRAASILGVRKEAPFHEITRAWRIAITTHHPDRFASNAAERAAAESKAKEINWAYTVFKRQAGAAV